MRDLDTAARWFVSVELHVIGAFAPLHGPLVLGPSAEALSHARARGLRTAVLVADRSFYGESLDDLVDRWIPCETRDPARIVEAVGQLPGEVLALSSQVDTFVGPAARAAADLRLRGPRPGSAGLARDKSVARAAVADAGIPDVRWAVVDAREPHLGSPLGYPAVMKPVDGAASWDVELVESTDQARDLAHRHLARSYPRGVSPQRRLIVEEFVPGPLFSAEGIVDGTGEIRLLGWSSRLMASPPHFAELAVTFARDEPFPGADDFARSLLRALAYDFGPFHLEVILGPSGPRFIELNPRLVGAGAHRCVEEVVGLSPTALAVGGLLGEPWPESSTSTGAGASTQMYFLPERNGVAEARPGPDMVPDWSGVASATSAVDVGDELSNTVRSSSDYLGWVITRGRDRAHSESVALAVLDGWRRALRAEAVRA